MTMTPTAAPTDPPGRAAPLSLGDWYREGRLAPHVRQHRTAGGAATLIEVAQPPGDMSDPPTTDLLVFECRTGDLRHVSDFGAGRFRATDGIGTMGVVAPGVATWILVETPHVIRVHALPEARWRSALAAARPNRDPFDFGPLNARTFRAPAVQRAARALWQAQAGTGAELLAAEGRVLALLAALTALADRPVTPARGGLAPRTARRCEDYLRAHFAADVTLADLSALAGLSPFHFARMFRESFGCPPHAYLRRLRAEAAQRLLSGTTLPVTGIAAAVGYDTPQAFARMFRAETGVTPSAWRRSVPGG